MSTGHEAFFATYLAKPFCHLSSQLVQQRLRLFQIYGVETFGEPVVNTAQQGASFFASPLLRELASKAGSRAQLEHFSFLATGYLNRSANAFFGLRYVRSI
jgi:hypothetical protein